MISLYCLREYLAFKPQFCHMLPFNESSQSAKLPRKLEDVNGGF